MCYLKSLGNFYFPVEPILPIYVYTFRIYIMTDFISPVQQFFKNRPVSLKVALQNHRYTALSLSTTMMKIECKFFLTKGLIFRNSLIDLTTLQFWHNNFAVYFEFLMLALKYSFIVRITKCHYGPALFNKNFIATLAKKQDRNLNKENQRIIT